MKKSLLLLLMSVLVFAMTGCASQDYDKAIRLMESENYQAAIEIFNSIPEYKDAAAKAEECEKYVEYNAAVNAFSEGRFEEACDTFASLGDFLDASDYVKQASDEISNEYLQNATAKIQDAVEAHDEKALLGILEESSNVKYGNEELFDNVGIAIVDAVNGEFKKPSYDSFLFLDSLIDLLHEQSQFSGVCEKVTQIRDENAGKRAATFLSGNWVRMDGTGLNGLRMQIIAANNQAVGIVLDDIDSKSGYYMKNDIKWTDVNILSDTMFSVIDHGAKTVYNKIMTPLSSVGTIDYDGMRIFLHSVQDQNNYSLGRNQVMVKEDALIDAEPLTTSDFVLKYIETGDENTQTEVNAFESSSVYYSSVNSNQFKLSRDIGIGSSWHDVVNAYGYGISNYFNTAFETVYKKIPLAESKMLSEQADQFMEYALDNHHIRFYFQDGTVDWIIVY